MFFVFLKNKKEIQMLGGRQLVVTICRGQINIITMLAIQRKAKGRILPSSAGVPGIQNREILNFVH